MTLSECERPDWPEPNCYVVLFAVEQLFSCIPSNVFVYKMDSGGGVRGRRGHHTRNT